MTKYAGDLQKKEAAQRKALHPIWYGIGCLMSILTPIISWAAASVLLDYGISQKWKYVMAMGGNVHFPDFVSKIPVINVAANYLSRIPFFEGLFLFFVLFLLIFSGTFALLNASLYRMFGPPRYTDIDAPPPPRRSIKKSR